ncbi:hypothetical protein NADFUDRAFT_82244 [Nadsonia fulvescens var. elongata DSM 6958]|uniref:PH domain-containing protein n=1 Tax=Nadsonia fulvescens var. elongata DSM 6958 TaxID=857566 RepID=A0A1E3PLV9_9ASCO|nr:hypothetical protein NADFUDRAFT_82244 [Nadsonia fulvescens var. elongata DSM 6958]
MDIQQAYEQLYSVNAESALADSSTLLKTIKYALETPNWMELSKKTNMALLCVSKMLELSQSTSVFRIIWSIVDLSLINQLVSIASSQMAPPRLVSGSLNVLSQILINGVDTSASEAGSPLSLYGEMIFSEIKLNQGFFPCLIGRLVSTDYQLVVFTLLFTNALLAKIVIPLNGCNGLIFKKMRSSGLFNNASIAIENRLLVTSFGPQIRDLQILLKEVMGLYADRPIDVADVNDPDSTTPQANLVKHMENLLIQLIGKNTATDNGAELSYGNNFGQVMEKTINWESLCVGSLNDALGLFNDSIMYSGLLDFYDFLHEDVIVFRKLFLEQIAFGDKQAYFPIIHASIAISKMLYRKFRLNNLVTGQERIDLLQGKSASLSMTMKQFDNNSASISGSFQNGLHRVPTSSSSVMSVSTTGSNVEDELLRKNQIDPLFFDFAQLHAILVTSLISLWKESNAQIQDFDNLMKLLELQYDQVVKYRGENDFDDEPVLHIDTFSAKLDALSYTKLREIQFELLNKEYTASWDTQIESMKEQFYRESFDFVKKQRISSLLYGDFFLIDSPLTPSNKAAAALPPPPSPVDSSAASLISTPTLNSDISNPIALTPVPTNSTSANASITDRFVYVILSPTRKTLHYDRFVSKPAQVPVIEELKRVIDLSNISKVISQPLVVNKNDEAENNRVHLTSRIHYNKISIFGKGARENVLLSFHSDTPELASEWTDGLQMLLNKPWQFDNTKEYIDMFTDLRIDTQLLNIDSKDVDFVLENPVDSVLTLPRDDISRDFFYN